VLPGKTFAWEIMALEEGINIIINFLPYSLPLCLKCPLTYCPWFFMSSEFAPE
jgi:hypothetical protein